MARSSDASVARPNEPLAKLCDIWSGVGGRTWSRKKTIDRAVLFCLALCEDDYDESMVVRTQALKKMLTDRTMANVADHIEMILRILFRGELGVETGVDPNIPAVVIAIEDYETRTERRFVFDADGKMTVIDRTAQPNNGRKVFQA